MAVAMRRNWHDDLPLRHRDSWWGRDDWLDDWRDWPKDWPQPREMMSRFWRDTDNWWRDWPTDWPRMDAVMPRMTTHLDRLDRNWRNDPFWMDIYPRWAEPIFKDGIDVKSNITNDERGFAVDIDAYQFRPEEIQVKTLDDTLMIEGRHEDVKDRDNFTKMYFVRKYQLPSDVEVERVQSSIDSRGRLTIEAPRRFQAITGRERVIPIEGPSRSYHSSPRNRNDSGFSNGYSSARSAASPIHVETSNDNRAREIRVDTNFSGDRRDYSHERSQSRGDYSHERSRSRSDYRDESGRDNRLSPNDGYSSHSYTYHRSESRSRLSPHEVTINNENRNFANASPRRISIDNRDGVSPRPNELRSPGRGAFNEIRDKFEKGRYASSTYTTTLPRRFRSQSRGAEFRESESRSDSRAREFSNGYHSHLESRNGYRVESPASSTTGILKNTTVPREDPPRSESRSESLRSVQILRKTFG